MIINEIDDEEYFHYLCNSGYVDLCIDEYGYFDMSMAPLKREIK